MNMRKLKNRILACTLVVSAVMAMAVYSNQKVDAATAIDTDRNCTVKWDVGSDASFSSDIRDVDVDVKLYKIAKVSRSQEYTPVDGFESLELMDKLQDGSATTAQWMETAKDAEKIVKDNSVDPIENGKLHNGQLSLTVKPGVYLVVMDPVSTTDYKYTFNPYLIFLPENEYFSTGTGSDDWIYNVDASIKFEREPNYGSIKIEKDLSSYANMLGEVTFVFQIEGEKDGVKYSNVASLTFTSAEKKSIVLDHIPAGMKLEVTEVYSGASYEISDDSEKVQHATVVADGSDKSVATVKFKNTYSDELIPSHGVMNMFTYDSANEEWQWHTDREN